MAERNSNLRLCACDKTLCFLNILCLHNHKYRAVGHLLHLASENYDPYGLLPKNTQHRCKFCTKGYSSYSPCIRNSLI